jgi:hypothetical protein
MVNNEHETNNQRNEVELAHFFSSITSTSKVEAIRSSRILEDIYSPTRRHVSEGSGLGAYICEILRSSKVDAVAFLLN